MKKICLVFPGVGSQHIGMGKEFYEQHWDVRETVDEASEILGKDIYKIWQDKRQKPQLDELNFAQVSLVALSYASYRLLNRETGLGASFMIGHSLGEYSALCSGGLIEFSDAIRLVQARGASILRASSEQKGTMLWVINLDTNIVEEVCATLRDQEIPVYISAYDTAVQCSISCLEKDIMTIASALEAKGALVYPLNLTGPFHSPLMQIAADEYSQTLEKVTFNKVNRKIIANETGQPYSEDIRGHLSRQLIAPVRWFQSLTHIEEQGSEVMIELGPKEVLTYLTTKGGKNFTKFNFNKLKHLNTLQEELVITPEDYIQRIARCKGVAVSVKNYNKQGNAYEEQVLKPYGAIENLLNGLSESKEAPEEKHLKQALNHLDIILDYKQVPDPIRQSKLEKLLSNKFTHLIPS